MKKISDLVIFQIKFYDKIKTIQRKRGVQYDQSKTDS